MRYRSRRGLDICWKDLHPPHEIGRFGFSISDVKKNEDGWVDAAVYRPVPYDMVHLKTQDKEKPGWWNGVRWEGLRVTHRDKINFWKFKEEV